MAARMRREIAHVPKGYRRGAGGLRRLIAILCGFLAFQATAGGAQQTGTVTGRVLDGATQRPIEGAQVYVRGTQMGSVTGANGRYIILNVPVGTHTLSALRLGYGETSQDVQVQAGQSVTVSFELGEEALGLEEIVVTGEAGGARRREIGNSISQIDMTQVAEPVLNTEALLQGRAQGLMISETSAAAGAGAYIRLRGNVSVTQSNHPLIYVDGVRIRSNPFPVNAARGRGNSSGAAASPLNLIDPNDIERVEVIKGAAATTLYGTEASAGVIQIFTKSGIGGGEPQWTAQSTFTVDNMLKYGTDEYPYMRMKPFLRNSFGQEYDLSVRGGIGDVTYFVSGLFRDDDGVLPNDSEEAYGVRGNLGFQGIENLSIQWNTSYTRRDLQNTPQTNSAAGLPLNVYRGDRNYVRSDNPDDLLGLLDYELTSRVNHLVTGLTFRHQPTGNWSQKLTIGYDFSFVEHRNYKPFGFLTDPQGVLQNQRWSNEIVTIDYSTSYELELTEDLSTTLSVGGQIVDDETASTTAWSQSFPGPGRPTVSSGSVQLADEERIRVVNAGVFAQGRFGYLDRVFLTAGLRVDGNTAFGEALGLEPYPKVSASYVVSEEDFWNPAWGDLKLRSAWGQSGRAPGAFDAVKTWAPVRYGDESAFYPQNLGNPELGPERTSELEFGFDGSWLDDRLSAQFTYYRQKTSEALFPVLLAPSSGAWNAQLENVGELKNKGVEIGVNGTVIQGRNLSWDLGAIVSTNNSEVLDLGGAPSFELPEGPGFIFEGQPAPVMYGNIVTNPDDIADPIYEPHFYGPNMPTTMITGTTTLRYRDVSLSMRGEYQGGHWAHSRLEEGDVQRNVTWPPCMDELAKGRENMTALERSYCIPELIERDYFFRPLDFFKMREITVQAPIPFGMLDRWNTTLTVSARNAIKWTKMEVFDPEMAGQNGSADPVRSIRDNVPPPSVYSVAIRMSF